jgi:TatD DNase family protein
LPAVIHQRAATAEVHRVLSDTSPILRCILHSFEGDEKLKDLGLERGYLFGVGGLVTRSSSEQVRDLIRRVPLEQILLETDSPYLVPAGLKSRRNEPGNIPRIAQFLAELLDVSVEHVADTTSRNAIEIFSLDQQSDVKRRID